MGERTGPFMFMQDALLRLLPAMLHEAAPRMEHARFLPDDFSAPDSEQTLWVHSGLRSYFEDGLFFWVKALSAEDGPDRRGRTFPVYALAGKCVPLGEAGFNQLIRECTAELRRPLPLFFSNSGRFIEGLLMYDDWNDRAAVVEYERGYIAVHWETTA